MLRAQLALALLCWAACRPAPGGRPSGARVSASASSSVAAAASPEPIHMTVLDPNATPPTFVMRGSPRGPARLVFLHGMCGHGLGYAQAFQFSAATKGTLIAPQGDVSCGGVWSKWSTDLVSLDARITETFRALGDPQPAGDMVIMGMSQGATRAAALARKFPERYTRLISMDAPTSIRPGELRHLRGAVMMAGERDRQDLMRASQRALAASGVPATFMLIPQATHGAMGPTPEKTMGEALDWLWQASRP
jgi:pimeloyl-ACP methyl ester carboxylesterase